MDPDHICRCCGGTGRKMGGSCPVCGANVTYGRGKNRKKISVEGSDHREVLAVMKKLSNDHDTPPILSLITHWSFWFGVLLVLAGVVLVLTGASGKTAFTFFGQSFESQNVAIPAFFLGAALVVLNVRRVLKSLDRRN